MSRTAKRRKRPARRLTSFWFAWGRSADRGCGAWKVRRWSIVNDAARVFDDGRKPGRQEPAPRARLVQRARRRSPAVSRQRRSRSEEHTSELQSLRHLVCRLLLEKKHKQK